MKKIIYIIIVLLFAIFSCGQQNNTESNLTTTSFVATNTEETLTSSADNKIEYIVFGRFCGECGGECATMYKFDVLNNKLFADHTDSYWKEHNGEEMKFETAVTDPKALAYAKELSENLPDFILNASAAAQKFGCPDCTDGCGLFFEIKKDNVVQKFRIDNQTNKLEGDVKTFAEELQHVIGKMK